MKNTIKYQALFTVLLFSLLTYSAKSQSASQEIFRYIDIGNDYKMLLGDNIDSHIKYLQKLDDNCFQFAGGIGDADEIFVYIDKNNNIRKFKFTYPMGAFFKAKVMSYKTTFGSPNKEMYASHGNYVEKAIWEDAKTKFTITSLLRRSVMYAELVNKKNVHHPYAEYINGNSISTRINLAPTEHFKDNKRNVLVPKLHLTTTQIYSSHGHQLKFTEFVTDDEFIIRFEEIKKPDGLSAQAEAPAKSSIDLPKNTHKLVLINGGIIDIYRVEISDKFISLSPVENSFTNLSQSKIARRAKNRFVCKCIPAISDSPICDNFFDVLRNNDSFTEYKPENKRKKPYFGVPKPKRGRYSKSFDCKNKTDFDIAIELLSDFVRKHNTKGKASISLGNWNGRRFADYDVVK